MLRFCQFFQSLRVQGALNLKMLKNNGLVDSELDSKDCGFEYCLIQLKMKMMSKPYQVNSCTQSWFIYKNIENIFSQMGHTQKIVVISSQK
jgi:hypothetical protein